MPLRNVGSAERLRRQEEREDVIVSVFKASTYRRAMLLDSDEVLALPQAHLTDSQRLRCLSWEWELCPAFGSSPEALPLRTQ